MSQLLEKVLQYLKYQSGYTFSRDMAPQINESFHGTRKAVERLARQGLVTTRKGCGTYLQPLAPAFARFSDLMGLLDEVVELYQRVSPYDWDKEALRSIFKAKEFMLILDRGGVFGSMSYSSWQESPNLISTQHRRTQLSEDTLRRWGVMDVNRVLFADYGAIAPAYDNSDLAYQFLEECFSRDRAIVTRLEQHNKEAIELYRSLGFTVPEQKPSRSVYSQKGQMVSVSYLYLLKVPKMTVSPQKIETPVWMRYIK